MDYNTSRNHLVLKEYGRNVQKLVEVAVAMENKEEQKELIRYIIGLMGEMNPHLRNIEEFRHKLWDQLYIISDFKLDVESPYPKPDRELIFKKPDHIGYPVHDIKFKHYGKNVERMVEKASNMEDEEKKDEYTDVIGNYMKMVYSSWNKENVNDEVIKNDINKLSGGKLQVPESSNLDALQRSNRKKRPDGPRAKGDGQGDRQSGDRRQQRGPGQGQPRHQYKKHNKGRS